jgi:type III pantothenate kinase
MNLILDIGNTRTKMALFDATHKVQQKKVQTECDCPSIEAFIETQPIEAAILTNSGVVPNAVLTWLQNRFSTFIHLSNTTPIPIANHYDTPLTLGKDRLAAAVGASVLFPNQHCLFIDCGTCLTYNIVRADGVFLGGNITPGVLMRLRAMHEFTARLPLVSAISDIEIQRTANDVPHSEHQTPYGTSTETALLYGAQWGALNEMEGFMSGFMQRFGHLKTLLTGGDADFFVKYIKKEIFAEPNLVLIGLNTILNYNNQQKK